MRSLITAMICLLVVHPTIAAEPKAKAPAGGRHALLVGCSKYPNLSEKFQLNGPANDVLLMSDLLMKQFQFKAEDIVVLSEKTGAKDAKLLPNRACIEREFKRLAQEAKAGDMVFILMGGHGSQMPESGKGEPEPDGLDEIFLPRDAGKWSDQVGTVENAIVDDDLGLWLQAIRDKKASICIIVDACHSGTMTRGNGEEVLRQLKPNDLGIPEAAIRKAVVAADKREAANPNRTRGGGTEITTPFRLADKGGLVAIYAAQPNEPTLEKDMPPRSADAKPYGLLTFTTCQILTQALAAGHPLTYRELAQRVQQQYTAWGRTFPTPVIEGGDRDREFLGEKVWEGRSSILLGKSEEGFKVNAGSLHGLTPDSILSVHPTPGEKDRLIGFVRVKAVRVNEADVEAVDYEKSAAVKDLPLGGACRVAFLDCGDQKIRVAIDDLDDAGKPITAELRGRLLPAINKLPGKGSMIEALGDMKKADWLIRAMDGDRILLIPASGWAGTSKLPPAFGPAPIDDKLEGWLRNALSSIGKVENLKGLAGREAGPPGEFGAQFEAELFVANQKTEWPSPNIQIFNKDKVRLTVKNTSKSAIDVTVLFIDSKYGIEPAFPDRKAGEFNRLKKGDKITLGFTANAKTIGTEHLLVIAVKAGDDIPADYTGLKQPSLEQFRVLSTRAKPNPLDKLIDKAAYGAGTSRGLSRDDDESPCALKLISWTIRPELRPLPTKK